MNLFKDDSTFCYNIRTEQTGGGVMVDYVHMHNGKILGITDECVCLFSNMEQGECGEQEDVIYLLKSDRALYISMGRIFKKVLKLCDGDMSLAKEAVEELFKETTIHHMSEIIDKLKK